MYLLSFKSKKLKSVFLKFFDFVFKYFFHRGLLQCMIFRLGFYGINLMLFFLNKILEVISFFLDKFKSLLILTLLGLVLIDPLQIQFLDSIFELCLSTWKSKLKIIKFSWKLKHVFLLFFYFWKKLLVYRHLLLSANFFLFNKILVLFDFLLKFLDWVLFGP